MSEETIGNGNVEEAVELLYYCNYGPESDDTPQFTGEMAKRAVDMGRHISKLSYDEILSADCILLDPKLLLTFRHCYDEDEFTFVQRVYPGLIHGYYDSKVARRKISLFGNSELNPYSGPRLTIGLAENALMINLFHCNTGLPGLKALWLWQCQMHLISGPNFHDPTSGWARKVEVIYNWIRFLTRPPTQQIGQTEEMFWMAVEREHRNDYNLYKGSVQSFVLVYGGIQIAIADSAARRALVFDIIGRLKNPVAEVGEACISIQDHAGKFDAKFICSGPFKFELTDDLASHLTFSPNDDQTILLFFDSQQYPGARLLIFKHNVIIGR
jgi:hypothetical protein